MTDGARCQYEVACSPPAPPGGDSERWLLEWTLEWADCDDVHDVTVTRSGERTAPPVTESGPVADEWLRITIETRLDCTAAGGNDDHQRLIEHLESVSAVYVIARYDDRAALSTTV